MSATPASSPATAIDIDTWPDRVDAVWRRAHDLTGEALVAAIDALAAERLSHDVLALFEQACARDTAGLETEAETFYRAALAGEGLDPYRRTRAVIQLGSTLRWLGRLDESERLLVDHLNHARSDRLDAPLHDETRALLALTWAAQDRGKEAAGLALATLAPRLSRYNRSTLASARQLTGEVWHRERKAQPASKTLVEGRFLMRPYREEDLAPFVAAVRESHDTVGRWMDWATADYSEREARAWFDTCATGWDSRASFQFGIFDRETGAFVGGGGLNQFNPPNGFCNLGYWIRRSRVRQGAATSATRAFARFGFDELKLHRIEIVVAVGNAASIGVARRCGAVEEGVQRNRVIVGGQPVAAHMFSLIP